MFEPMKTGLWQGRVDSCEPGDSRRWHDLVQPLDPESAPGIALLGLCCDEGVRRNQGRVGARNGPNAIRQALANQAWHLNQPLYDAGNLHPDGDDLEAFSRAQAEQVEQLLAAGHFPLLLGGGHEIAYGSFLGLANFARTRLEGPIGVLNFDAHFDLRQDHQPSSGTPFLQIAEWCEAHGQSFNYACLGVSETANTRALFERADRLGVHYLRDEQISEWHLEPALAMIERFITPLAALYLTIDLDVLPAGTMPGVSAPAGHGVALPALNALIAHVQKCAGSRLRLADLAELNPVKDIDNRSARVAARLCHQILKTR
ncbi:formimidoylglutamase [Motiliproteus sediminis]|uniref:formimidoylglutamase n=1 Tax=Motiliproteus sediminis TaxID=1468178 RepID=UPI001AEFDBD1|nr:formimidoylglutamase [Motiliproteus sediminis]